ENSEQPQGQERGDLEGNDASPFDASPITPQEGVSQISNADDDEQTANTKPIAKQFCEWNQNKTASKAVAGNFVCATGKLRENRFENGEQAHECERDQRQSQSVAHEATELRIEASQPLEPVILQRGFA